MPARPEFSLAVIILAAGKSSRMGQPKMLLPWKETTVVGHLISLWQELRANQIAVVHAADDMGMDAELDRLEFSATNRIANPQADRGMFSSIQCAAEWGGWNHAATHWAVVLGDQPHLRTETLAALINFARQYPEKICQPGRGGHGKHPIVLPKMIFGALQGSKEASLKSFLSSRANAIKLMETEDAGLDFDIDVPADYEWAKAY